MKNLIKTLKEIWAVDELKKRILYTLGLILVYRIGSFIVLPGIDADKLASSAAGDNILDKCKSDLFTYCWRYLSSFKGRWCLECYGSHIKGKG